MQAPSAADLRAFALALRNPLLQYRPGPAHERFLRDPARFRVLRAPNQTGKTIVGCAELLWAALDRHPHRAPLGRPVRAAVLCHSFEQSKVVQRKLHELTPAGVLSSRTHYDEVLGYRHRRVDFRNGSTVKIQTTEQASIAVASDTLDLVWMDEPPPPHIFAEAVSRLVQTGGRLYMTFTPVGRPLRWLRDIIEADGSAFSETHYGLSVESCPWMSQEQVDEAIRTCLPTERPQRIYGEWDGVTVDRLLDGFDDDNLRDSVPHDGAVDVWLVADHGERPGAEVWLLVFAWRGRDGKPYAHVVDEYASQGRTTEEQDAEHVRRMLERHGLSLFDVDRCRGDVNTAGKSHARMTVNGAFEVAFGAQVGGRCPFRVEKPRKGPGSVMRGARVVNVALLENRLTIDPRCTRLLESVRHWTGDDGDLKHAFDALSYFAYDTLDPTEAADRGRIAVG